MVFGLKVPGSERDLFLALFKGKFANESNHGTYGFVPDSHIEGKRSHKFLKWCRFKSRSFIIFVQIHRSGTHAQQSTPLIGKTCCEKIFGWILYANRVIHRVYSESGRGYKNVQINGCTPPNQTEKIP